MRLFLLIVGLAQVFLGFSTAATLSSNGSSADVQAKISSAQAGDTITIPAGTFSGWNVSLSKGLTLKGAGTQKTIIKGNGTTVVLNVPATTGTSRLTGLTFDGGTVQSVLVRYNGNGAALVDHCEFIGGGASEMIHNESLGAGNKAGWTNDVTPGSADALYVEDCVFSKNPYQDQYFWGTSALQGYYGSRTVFRHNTMNYCQIDQHGTAGSVGARWFEIYDNTFNTPNAGQCCFVVLRGGSGVVFGNKLNGPGGGIQLYDENNQSEPPLYLARGINQNLSPVYIWDNAAGLVIRVDSSNVKEGRDFFASATQPSSLKRWQLSTDNANTTFAYIPYTYPHPMAGGSPMPTPAPTATPEPTATPAPSATPTPPPGNSTKFKVGDTVKLSPNDGNIRATPAGALCRYAKRGNKRDVTAGPEWGQLPDASSGVYWWKIDFPCGSDGWVGEDNLVKSQAAD